MIQHIEVLPHVQECSVKSYLVYERDMCSLTSCTSVICEVLPRVRAWSVKFYLVYKCVFEVLPRVRA